MKRIVLRVARPFDLVGGREPERRAVGGEVEMERVMRGRDHAERSVDGRRGGRIPVRIEEARLVAERRLRAPDPVRDGMRIATRTDQRCELELLGVRERGARVQAREARLDPIAKPGERAGLQQVVERLDVRVDRQHLHAVGAEKAREHGDGEVRRGRVARRWLNEGYAGHSGRLV
jgi:hypothetical protein